MTEPQSTSINKLHFSWIVVPTAVALASSVAGLSLAGTPWTLITSAEAARSATVPPPLATRALPDPLAPRIIVELPSPGHTVRSPTAIRLRFEAVSGARVLPATLRVRYGALGLDVTSRVLERYRPTAGGIAVENAALPPGRHVFNVSIEDDRGRIGRQKMEISVDEGAGGGAQDRR